MPSREEMVEDLVSDVDDWDTGTLLGWVKFEMRLRLEAASDHEIESDWEVITEREDDDDA